ncbi:MAG: TlpA disulfide reductase family protein [Steroidobacteraceae bacterium]|jgi:peroxiredoxin
MIDRGLRFAGAVLVALVAVWSGARIHSAWVARSTGGGIATPVGEASPPTRSDLEDQPPRPPPAKIPDQLPDFSLAGLDGKLMSIHAWSGKSLVINFWATWCAPCRREIPLLEGLSGEWANRGVTVIGIAVDHRDQVASFARELKISYPLLIGEQEALDVAGRFGVDSPVFPFTVFTDRRGEVVALYVGELRKPQADLILSTVQDLDQNHIALQQARQAIAEGLHALPAANPESNPHNS